MIHRSDDHRELVARIVLGAIRLQRMYDLQSPDVLIESELLLGLRRLSYLYDNAELYAYINRLSSSVENTPPRSFVVTPSGVTQ